MCCPGCCGSVGWTLACKLKGHWFDSQSGPMRGLWARSPVGGVWEATTHQCFSPSLSPSLPLSLKVREIKSFLKNHKKRRYVVTVMGVSEVNFVVALLCLQRSSAQRSYSTNGELPGIPQASTFSTQRTWSWSASKVAYIWQPL